MYIEYMYFMVGTVKLVKSKTVKRKNCGCYYWTGCDG